jgi:hypothetical protein
MSLQELMTLCPPPPTPCEDYYAFSTANDLPTHYGRQFPTDYVDFCKAYGTGRFVGSDTHEIFIFNAFESQCKNYIDHSLKSIKAFFRNQRMLRRLTSIPISVESIFPLGRDTEKTYLCWITRADPAKWIVLTFNYDAQSFDIFDSRLTDFLSGYFAGRRDVPLWRRHVLGTRVQHYQFKGPEEDLP